MMRDVAFTQFSVLLLLLRQRGTWSWGKVVNVLGARSVS